MSTSRYRAAFGLRVRELRVAAGWSSQEAFAYHVDVDRTYVSGIERGVRNPSLDVIVKLAAGLGVHPVALMETLPGPEAQ